MSPPGRFPSNAPGRCMGWWYIRRLMLWMKPPRLPSAFCPLSLREGLCRAEAEQAARNPAPTQSRQRVRVRVPEVLALIPKVSHLCEMTHDEYPCRGSCTLPHSRPPHQYPRPTPAQLGWPDRAEHPPLLGPGSAVCPMASPLPTERDAATLRITRN